MKWLKSLVSGSPRDQYFAAMNEYKNRAAGTTRHSPEAARLALRLVALAREMGCEAMAAAWTERAAAHDWKLKGG